MDFIGIGLATVVVAVTGLLIGLLIGVVGKKFHVEVDEKESQVRDLLPGNNCGGCGYAGCDALACAIAKGEAEVNACPVGGPSVSEAIAEVMGVEAASGERKVAFVKCSGTCDKAKQNFNYYGVKDCKQAMMAPGGSGKACSEGCMGFGTCVKACPFDAISLVNGVAFVDKEKCVACGKCVVECPKQLIELTSYHAEYLVHCNSTMKGKAVKDVCQSGCIGCTLCVRQCEFDAIKVTNNLAYIDQDKCEKCGKCAAKCPVKVIKGNTEI